MKYKSNRHHRRSIRLKGYDYSQAAMYFISICAKDRECVFGEIMNDEMRLNDAGHTANACWLEIPTHFPNVILHEHIVMPNHVHGIIELTATHTPAVGEKYDLIPDNVGVQNFEPLQIINPLPNGTKNTVGVENIQPKQPTNTPEPQRENQFQHILPRSVGSIVRGFKTGVTKWFRQHTDVVTVWQRNYYEHIIRSQQSYYTISEYILNNPEKWKEDIFYMA